MTRLNPLQIGLIGGSRLLLSIVLAAAAVLSLSPRAYATLPPDSGLRSNIVSWANYELTNTAHNKAIGYSTGGYPCNFYSGYWGNGGTGCKTGWLGANWCADFAKYAWSKAGAYTAGLSYWADSFRVFGGNHGTFYARNWTAPQTYTPKAGDVVSFDWDPDPYPGGTDAYGYDTDHVAIITSVSGDYIYVVGGNQGAAPGVVSKVSYNWKTDLRIVGYTQPLYP